MNTRIKAIRKDRGMTQVEFGKALHLSKNYLSNVETGHYPIAEKFIDELCRTFNVNENWLRTGIGDMYDPVTEEEEIADIVATLYKDDGSKFRFELIKAISKISDDELEVCLHFFEDVLNNTKKNDQG